MEKKYKKCPYCLEKIRAEAIKCRYCEEWLNKDKKELSEIKDKPSKFKKIKSLIARIILWSLIFYMWLIYAFSTLDRSEEALKETSNTGPIASGYSIPILGLIFLLLLRKVIFSKSKKLWNWVIKIIVFLIIIIGLAIQIDYDPTLSKLHNYYEQEQDAFIPAQHQQERFSYLELSDLETKANKAKIETTVKLKNNSYTYNMKDVKIRLDFFEDEKKEKLIESSWIDIEEISSRQEASINSSIENTNKAKAWYVYATIENATLVKK